jgi:hypothetical protein
MVDKRIEAEVTHAFIEFCDKASELGFRFDIMGKIDLTYIKGEAFDSPHDMRNKLSLCPDDFTKKVEDNVKSMHTHHEAGSITDEIQEDDVISKKARQSQFL